MRSVHSASHAVAAIALVAGVVSLTAQSSQLPAAASAQIDSFLASEQARQKIPGMSVAVAFRNQLVYSKAYGTADLEHAVPASTTTAFRTASVAKPLTATAVMGLVEAGRIDLDADVRKYCAAWPEKHPPATVRQVMAHTAGIRHYVKPGESVGKTHYFVMNDALALFKDDPLLHAPGTRYLYSTFGYSLVGCAIEGASGTTYEQYMRERVFTKAAMTRTRLDRLYEVVPDRSRGYQVLSKQTFDALPAAVRSFARVGEVYNSDFHDTSMKVPGGGLLSTAEDLVRFGIALNTGKLLGKAAVDTMWTLQKTNDGKDTGYGLGWGVQPPQDGISKLSHSGNQAGASSVIVILPEVGVTYAIMTNLEDADMNTISRGLANALRDALMKKQ